MTSGEIQLQDSGAHLFPIIDNSRMLLVAVRECWQTGCFGTTRGQLS